MSDGVSAWPPSGGSAYPAAAGLRTERPVDGVCVLVLDRPGHMNAIDGAMFVALLEELERIGADRAVRAVVITGAGGAFSAGGDLQGIAAIGHHDADEIEAMLARIMRVSALLHALPQPTIAAIDGPVVGGALGLALACGIRIASPRSMFLSSFIRMGMTPDCGVSWLLPRLIGEGRALELMLTGRPVDAHRAETIGLVDRVCEDPLDAAIQLAATFAGRPAGAVVATKQLVREVTAGDLPAAIDREATAQAQALTGPEFASSFERWRATRNPD
jgi:enoyl-CoA hydratase/carnithine racemase